MNKITILIALLLLAGYASVQAQSGDASKGKTGASSVNTTPKDNNSQMEGKGVPYSKDKKSPKRPGSNKPIPPSSIGTESDVSATAEAKISPGSHGAQRDPKAPGRIAKPRSHSTGKP